MERRAKGNDFIIKKNRLKVHLISNPSTISQTCNLNARFLVRRLLATIIFNHNDVNSTLFYFRNI